MMSALNQWIEQFLGRQAARGKWSFVVRVGLLAWGIPMLCAINLWFAGLTSYPPLRVLLFSATFCLGAGILLGLGLYRNARKAPDELREHWLRNMQRGELRFVWRYGVLAFGGTMFIAFSALLMLTLKAYPAFVLAYTFATCLIIGAAFGFTAWSNLRKKYQ